MTWAGLKRTLIATYHNVGQHHGLQAAAALSYYFILAIFPALILLSAIMGIMPVPDLFGGVVHLMSRLLPTDAMGLMQSTLLHWLRANHKAWFSFGMAGTVWVTSAAFDAVIEALDTAYQVETPRPIWKTRLLAIGLAAMTGALLFAAFALLTVGPRVGAWLGGSVFLSHAFIALWPFMGWVLGITFAVLEVELIYFLAPAVKQRLLATLPGAILTVVCWVGFSDLLGAYFRHYATFDLTYGTLAGFIALMTWFYWNLLALLVGAELNAGLAKENAKEQAAKAALAERSRFGRAA